MKIKFNNMFFNKTDDWNTVTVLLGFLHNKHEFMVVILGVAIKFDWRKKSIEKEPIETYEEKIICPNCKSIEIAKVEITWPWNTYIHYCSKCEYTIMESEWDRVKE